MRILKTAFITLFVLSLALPAYAQEAPAPQVQGINSEGDTLPIGAGGASVMNVLSNGSVGIGTTNSVMGTLDVENKSNPGHATICLNGQCTQSLNASCANGTYLVSIINGVSNCQPIPSTLPNCVDGQTVVYQNGVPACAALPPPATTTTTTTSALPNCGGIPSNIVVDQNGNVQCLPVCPAGSQSLGAQSYIYSASMPSLATSIGQVETANRTDGGPACFNFQCTSYGWQIIGLAPGCQY